MINVAVLGYGTVGSGVVELLFKNNRLFASKTGQPVAVKYILDIRSFPGDRYESLLVRDIETVLRDPEINVVVETIGGAGVAYEFTRRALQAGKNVVTSNKELVNEKGPELLALARENGVRYLFEASVGGGIPVILPMMSGLGANEIHRIVGILNGTTNYILTKMKNDGMSFEDALGRAQQFGYAEANPSADIDGLDTCRKLCILASLSFGKYVHADRVRPEGIRGVTPELMTLAEQQGYRIKLIGSAQRLPDGIVEMFVGPAAVPASHPLANIEDVFNGILVSGDATGDVLFYGKGAGKMPTASAVCSDIIECSKPLCESILWDVTDNDFVRSPAPGRFEYLEGTNIPIVMSI